MGKPSGLDFSQFRHPNVFPKRPKLMQQSSPGLQKPTFAKMHNSSPVPIKSLLRRLRKLKTTAKIRCKTVKIRACKKERLTSLIFIEFSWIRSPSGTSGRTSKIGKVVKRAVPKTNPKKVDASIWWCIKPREPVAGLGRRWRDHGGRSPLILVLRGEGEETEEEVQEEEASRPPNKHPKSAKVGCWAASGPQVPPRGKKS